MTPGPPNDELLEETNIKISRFPYACQAANPECAGWLFGSMKVTNSNTFIEKIREKLKIPEYVALGVTYRTIRDKFNKPYLWDREYPPPQALHLDIDQDYIMRYLDILSRTWSKGSSGIILGLNLRLVLCFSSERAKALSENQRRDIKDMAKKRQYLTNERVQKMTNATIANLDYPIGPYETTLREFIMSRSPPKQLNKRIFLAVERDWKGSNFNLITMKGNYSEAYKILQGMTPQCFFLYGKDAEKWFNNKGITMFKGVKYDLVANCTVGEGDKKSAELVEEDLFDLGSGWRESKKSVSRQTEEPDFNRASDALVKSFGSFFRNTGSPSKVPEDVPVSFDPVTLKQKNLDDGSVGASTLGSKTKASKGDGVSREQYDKLLEENRLLVMKAHSRSTPSSKSVSSEVTTKSTKEEFKQLKKSVFKWFKKKGASDSELESVALEFTSKSGEMVNLQELFTLMETKLSKKTGKDEKEGKKKKVMKKAEESDSETSSSKKGSKEETIEIKEDKDDEEAQKILTKKYKDRIKKAPEVDTGSKAHGASKKT